MAKRIPRQAASRRFDRALLLHLLDEAYDHKAWHGPNLTESIRGVTPRRALWRPGAGRNNIAEIVVHCAFWKFMARKRITGDKRLTFPLDGRNWFPVSRLTSPRWEQLQALLDAEHAALRTAVETLPARSVTRLDARPGKSPANQVYGVALHDTYHAGQIRLLRAMQS